MPATETLIDDLYMNLLVKENYQGCLDLLCNAFDAHGGGIMSVDGNNVQMLAAHSLNLESVSVYNDEFNEQDYLVPFLKVDNQDKVIFASNAVRLPEIESSDYYQYVDRPSDVYDKMSFYVVTPKEQFALALYRDKKRLYSKSELELANRIKSHVFRCFRVLASRSTKTDQLASRSHLTKKEKEIVTLVSLGNDYAHIKAMLNISSNTLKWHMKNIFQKLEVRNYSELFMTLRSLN